MKKALAISISAFSLWAHAALAQESGAPGAAPADASGVVNRVERLEEQIVDLQGVVAAVESLAKSGGGGANGGAMAGYPSAGGGLSDDQFRQLSEQIADITQRLERLEARFGMSDPAAGGRRDFGAASPGALPQRHEGPAPDAGTYSASRLPPADSPSGFGTAIEPQDSGRSSVSAADESPGSVFGSSDDQPRPRTAALAATTSPAAKALYDQAFGALQRREYRAAETYFQEFVTKFPTDALAGEAHFYFGEAAYQSAEYREAADRFLRAYTDYPASEKAPEALLKLAMSLRRLGEDKAACDSFAEFARRFPNAPENVRRRAETEKRRANCA